MIVEIYKTELDILKRSCSEFLIILLHIISKHTKTFQTQQTLNKIPRKTCNVNMRDLCNVQKISEGQKDVKKKREKN